jgi:hypothetical protein
MSSDLPSTVVRVCSLAREYFSGDSAPNLLFQRSQYRLHAADVTTQLIEAYLAEHPENVGFWYAYSENKRTDRGWHLFFSPDERDNSVEFLEGARAVRKEVYVERLKACAAYIKHEFEFHHGF